MEILNTPKTICDALRDLVLFVQFKKREKHPWTSVNFSKVAGFSRLQALGLKTTATELKTSHQHLSNEKKTECFFRFVQPL